MRRFFTGFCFVLLLCGGVLAAPNLPALTGRVIDNAHLLSAGAHQQLEQALADYEQGTTNQVVVTTVPSLDGVAIEEYGVQLGRYWHIGQKGKDNGVLLIIAPKEHQAHIEVGYGLEGVLTDALSSQIIQGVILPDFRAGNMEKGVVDGTQAVLSVLGGKSMPAAPVAPHPSSPIQAWHILLVLLGIVGYIWLCIRHPDIAWFLFRVAISFGGRSSSGSGGFGGGGGSFGGGGASGRW
jgi:uncharacterized protein